LSINIIILGAGKVATHIGQALLSKGCNIQQVYNRTETKGIVLASALNSIYINDIKYLRTDADIYILALRDDVLMDLITTMPLVSGIVCHTSGKTPMSIFERFANHGVFYPFQTFSENKAVDFTTIPIMIEANTEDNLAYLRQLAAQLTTKVLMVNSHDRLKYHLAAIYINNFSNHLYMLAFRYVQKNNLDTALLHPLMLETAEKAIAISPAKAQTGPAQRSDMDTIARHLQLLQDDEQMHRIYQILTESIMQI